MHLFSTYHKYLYGFQIFYYGKVLEKANSMDNWQDKVSAVVKGPGWFPGTERLGDPMGVPEVCYIIRLVCKPSKNSTYCADSTQREVRPKSGRLG